MHEITRMPGEFSHGNNEVLEDLLPIVYDELKRIAAGYLRRERADHTLQTTALVNESYLRLRGQTRISWQNRSHFFGVAAQIMRRILIDHARSGNAGKRGGGSKVVQFDESIDKMQESKTELIRLNEALDDLAKIDPPKARLVELRYFGGLSFEEAAQVLGISHATAKRHWRIARAFLYGHLSQNS